MTKCIMCKKSCPSKNKYCPNCKRVKDNTYSILNKVKKRIAKLVTEEKYDEHWYIKLLAAVEAIKPQRTILLDYIKVDIELLEGKVRDS